MTQRPIFCGYSQGQYLGNLSRLLSSLRQAQISHVLLEPKNYRQAVDFNDSVVKILTSEAGLEKFHQVFVGQRFISLDMGQQNLFWDTRTGLTLEIHLPQNRDPYLAQHRLADPSVRDGMY
jgi:hypothetical protein